MANLSQQRRQRMLDFLQKVREKNKDDDDALVAIGEIENEITEKKYGLVWEEHSEEVEERMVEEVPVFVEDKDKEITLTEDGYNFLLEGDNLHSLHLLEKTHKEKIDVIYIDPPYNTGNDDFVYDDKKIGRDDAYRHSMWLSFMERRLRIAKDLLSERGFIIISIDNNEQSTLKLLCDSIFGEMNFVSNMVRKSIEGGKAQSQFLQDNYDYALVYAKNTDYCVFSKQEQHLEHYTKKDEHFEERGYYYLKPLENRGLGYVESLDYGIESPDGEMIYPGGVHGNNGYRWVWSKEKYKFALDNDMIVFVSGRDGKKKIYYKIYEKVNSNLEPSGVIMPYPSLLDDVTFSNRYASNNLKKIVSSDFSYSKSPELVKFFVNLMPSTESVILDFFAGSGTTGQAVLELNKEDGGNRKFILCTNNENNICEGVTYPRLQTVITGVRQDGNKYSDGIPANLKYYKTDYIPKKSDNLSADLIKHIDEMIQLEYHVKIDKDKYISILTDEDADELEKNWQNFPNIRAIYISRSVLLTGKQRELFETKDCFVIPDYYFREELRDAGEA